MIGFLKLRCSAPKLLQSSQDVRQVCKISSARRRSRDLRARILLRTVLIEVIVRFLFTLAFTFFFIVIL